MYDTINMYIKRYKYIIRLLNKLIVVLPTTKCMSELCLSF